MLLPLSDPFVGITRREYMKLRDVDDILAHSIGAQGTDSSLLFGVPGNTYNGGGSPDMTSARLDVLFADLKSWLPSLLEKVVEKQAQTPLIEPQGPFPIG